MPIQRCVWYHPAQDSDPVQATQYLACEDFLHKDIKGARSAPDPAGRGSWVSAARGVGDPDAAQLVPVTGRAFRENVARLGAACRS